MQSNAERTLSAWLTPFSMYKENGVTNQFKFLCFAFPIFNPKGNAHLFKSI